MRIDRQGDVMNSNQIKGTAKDVAGKVQESVGKVVGSPEQRVKGVEKQIEGKLQKGVGNVQEAAKESRKTADRAGD
jgi:uncharacterized protein YjbJ (UPF0337 family)